MYKNFKIVSLSMIVALALVGCGHSSNPAINDEQPAKQELPKVSKELKSLVKSSRSDIETNLNKLPSATQSNGIPLATETKNCTNGGTMNFTNDFNQTAIMGSPNDFNITMTSEAVDCVESGITINGKIETVIRMLNQKQIMTITYLTDFNITDGAKNYVIKQGSKTVSTDIDENSTFELENMEITSSDESYKSIDLKSHESDINGVVTSYPISGKEIVGGVVFIVDESYDASQTPQVYDTNDNLLKGGKTLYTNDQNHSIVIEAIEKNKIQISVDEDRDGKFDKQEIVSM